MPRSSSSRRSNKWQRPAPERDLGQALAGMRRSVEAGDGQWVVQEVRGNDSGRSYTCPGCHQTVAASVAHTVAWRVEGAWGADGVESRRHWHEGCFRARQRRR